MLTVSSSLCAQDELLLDNVLHEVDYSWLLYLHVLISSWAFLLTTRIVEWSAWVLPLLKQPKQAGQGLQQGKSMLAEQGHVPLLSLNMKSNGFVWATCWDVYSFQTCLPYTDSHMVLILVPCSSINMQIAVILHVVSEETDCKHSMAVSELAGFNKLWCWLQCRYLTL